MWKTKEARFKATLRLYDGSLASLRATNKVAAQVLRTVPCFARLDRKVVRSLEQAQTETETNAAIEKVYDYADENRVWLGFGEEA